MGPEKLNKLVSTSGNKLFFACNIFDFLVQHFVNDYENSLGAINNRLSGFIMGELMKIGISTHFIKIINMREQLIKRMDVLPIRVVIKNMKIDCHQESNIPDNAKLPMIEFMSKVENEYKICCEDHLYYSLLDEVEISEIKSISFRTNDFIRGIFAVVGINVKEIMLKFGRDKYNDDLPLVGDISANSCILENNTSRGNISLEKKMMNIISF